MENRETEDENMGLKGAKTKGDKLISSLLNFRWPTKKRDKIAPFFECPCCGADLAIENCKSKKRS